MLETKNQTTIDISRGKNAINLVRVMFLEVEMDKVRSVSCIKRLSSVKNCFI